jgi:predicted ATP-grasp superfamily ATP-dependent carboligase
MRIFLYEFVTGGGWYSYGDEPCPGSLVREGRAIVQALGADFAACDGVSLAVLHDRHMAAPEIVGAEVHAVGTRFEELAAFKTLASRADWTLVIAPEMSGFLAQRSAIVNKVGGRLLGPALPAIRLSSDKQATADLMALHGVNTPAGVPLERNQPAPDDFNYPAVLKPRDGAGSIGVRLVQSADQIGVIEQPSRLEEFLPGQAVSVSFLCGPKENVALAPCRQLLSDDGKLVYLGGTLPLEPALAERSIALGERALAALGPLTGYLGVDLVLGGHANGSADAVIEINARMTTSYVGLRALARTNLAAALLDIADGRSASIEFETHQLQFDADGRIWSNLES